MVCLFSKIVVDKNIYKFILTELSLVSSILVKNQFFLVSNLKKIIKSP